MKIGITRWLFAKVILVACCVGLYFGAARARAAPELPTSMDLTDVARLDAAAAHVDAIQARALSQIAPFAAEKEARAVEKKAQRAAGAAYGGSWFDAEKGALVVAVSDRAAADAVTGAGASVRLVEHSAKTLDAAKERIDGLDAPRGVAGWRVDPQANSVVVSVVGDQADGKAVRGFVERARAAGPVEVETVAAAPETFAAGTVGGDPYYTGNVRCSIGFSVHGGFVTAGHCGPTGQGDETSRRRATAERLGH